MQEYLERQRVRIETMRSLLFSDSVQRETDSDSSDSRNRFRFFIQILPFSRYVKQAYYVLKLSPGRTAQTLLVLTRIIIIQWS